ncbi:MAG: hypothetical protein EPN93_18605 [Spirochaetes bacterium]|nr:MAG: hypothetical protein EPN93_18605 [Spirochaetota bacterium]
MGNTIRAFLAGIFAASAALGGAGCGESYIADMKSFEKNESPVIDTFTSNIDPLAVEIYPGMEMLLTVKAHDIEGDPITYAFKSAQGTMRNLVHTADGCTVDYFIKSTCGSSDSIPITVIATDDKGASSSRTIDMGDGTTGPVFSSSTWTGSTTLASGGTMSVDFSVDRSGFYQVRFQNSLVSTIDFDMSHASFFYTAGDPKTVIFHALTGTDENTNLPAAGTYNVYVLLLDKFNRLSCVSNTVTVID